ncbi:ATP-binding cassette domain-containing protein [Deinococcus hopiensis]|jgi:ABC-2 type transport system ATP-binding protein|uniref:ATP-binding cassette domain-containing protein n=1 Tax=Deinococcus hopiensis TaxID=309885 RepID=UPI00269F6815
MTSSQPDASVQVRDARKSHTVHEKEPGFLGNLRSFVRRKGREVEAVRGVTSDLAPGEVVGFVGPNGAGKTTTLKMLSGLLHPSGGEVWVAGFEPRRQADFLRPITMVMGQKQQLIWDLPALDSFLVNQAIYEISGAQYRETMAEFTEVLGLEGIRSAPLSATTTPATTRR